MSNIIRGGHTAFVLFVKRQNIPHLSLSLSLSFVFELLSNPSNLKDLCEQSTE